MAIGRLERWVGDNAIAEGWASVPYIEPNGFKVGIVGSGPAGLACAADMAKAGCDVTVFEAFHQLGGVLRYGIPDFRLPGDVIDAEINNFKNAGRHVRMQYAWLDAYSRSSNWSTRWGITRSLSVLEQDIHPSSAFRAIH